MKRDIINTTPHEIRFRNSDGSEFSIEPCGTLLNATVREEVIRAVDGINFVRTVFSPNQEGLDFIAAQPKNAIIVGSMIAAQAYKGKVCALTPAQGFERVPVDEKRMNPDKFTIF